MRSFTCVSVVVYAARKLRPCLSYSRRRDRINLVLWRSLDKGGGILLSREWANICWISSTRVCALDPGGTTRPHHIRPC